MIDSVRVDRWLWTARFYKTRRLALEAVVGGKVHVSGHRVKPGRRVSVGDELCLNRAGIEMTIVICGLSTQRGPASSAQQLYRETEDSCQLRQSQIEQRRLISQPAPRPDRRPGKKDRRDIARFRGH